MWDTFRSQAVEADIEDKLLERRKILQRGDFGYEGREITDVVR